MGSEKEIQTVVIQLKRYVIFLWPYIFGGVALSLLGGLALHSLPLLLIGVGFFILSPGIFSSQFRRGFSKNARLQFFPDRLIIELRNRDTDAVERTNVFPFAEVASFRTGDSFKDDSSYISLLLSDGRKFNYTFLGQGQGDGTDDVTPNLEEYIRTYNHSTDRKHAIAYMPSMLASQVGKNLLTGVTVLMAVGVVIQIIIKPKTIPYSMIMGSVLYLLLLVQRKSDLAKFKAMNNPGRGMSGDSRMTSKKGLSV